MSKTIKHPATKQAETQDKLREAAWISYIKINFVFRYLRVVGKATWNLLKALALLSWTAVFNRKRYRRILNTLGADFEITKRKDKK